jgi:hypothetical protein
MNRSNSRIALALSTILALTSASLAQVPADEQAFLDKHMSEVVAIVPKRLSDAAVTKTIAAPVYELNITINSGDGGTMQQKQIAARVGDKLLAVSRPGTDGPCPDLQKMMNPIFMLKTDDDAKQLQTALDAVFPPVTDDEKKAVAFAHTGHDWMFYRGAFFGKKLGFVFTTDAVGKVTGVKFSLQL